MSDALTATAPVKADAPAGGEKVIEMIGVNKWYGEFHVLKDINLSVNKGEVVVVDDNFAIKITQILAPDERAPLLSE